MDSDGGARRFWAETVYFALDGGAYVGAGVQAVNCLVSGEPWNWVGMLLAGGTWAAGMTLFAGLQRVGCFPSRGDREGRALLRTALATGALPADARPSAWATLLESEIRELNRARWATLVLGFTVTALVAVAAGVLDDSAVSALAIALGGFATVPFRVLKLRRERYEALLAQVPAG
jgi:hypothetical protein